METEKQARVLIVDDDKSTCETLSDIFQQNDFQTLVATNGRESLELLQKQDVDVVLLDIKLPDVDGLYLLESMKKITPDIIAVFMTGFASVEYVKRAYEQGANGFFVKPVLIEEILHVINEALEKRIFAERYICSEEERKSALEEYTDLYNNAPIMYASVDAASSTIVQCNQMLLDTLGYRRDEVVGHSVLGLYHPDYLEEVESDVIPTFLKTGRIKNRELKLKTKGGAGIPVTLDVTAVRDKDNNIVQSRSMYHDISDRKMLEEQLLISEKMTTIAGLAAGVAHEINTPLSGILQSIQVIEMGLAPEKETNQILAADCGLDLESLWSYLRKKELDFFLDGIRNSATTAACIVSDLLQFSHPKASEWVTVDIGELIDRSIALASTDYALKKDFKIHNIDFIKEFCPEPLMVECMPIELEQVFINLIKNSCQAMVKKSTKRGNPQIVFRIKHHEDLVVIEVEDNGPGMDNLVLRQVFNPFFTTKDVGVGTGLGLSVSYSIICEKHGGTLQAFSTPGKGTKMVIELPILGVGSSRK